MASLFGQKQSQTPMSPRAALEAKYHASRGNLLLVVAFTLINLVLLLTNSYTYFLFSASLPYVIVDFGMFFCGKYPAEVYADVPDMIFLDPAVLVVMVVIAVVIVGVYLLCWFMSKKNNVGWLVAALVLFIIDTVSMFLFMGIDASMIIDVVFHAWVLYYLVTGIIAHKKLKALPVEEPVMEAVGEDAVPFVENVADGGEATNSDDQNV